jgi:hypothetical protein
MRNVKWVLGAVFLIALWLRTVIAQSVSARLIQDQES